MDASELPMLHSSAEINELAGALAAAQAEFSTVAKDNTAKVETTKGPGYTYKYADLASCLAAVRGPLSNHGLAVMQTTVPGGQDLMLRTILAHKSGQWIASDFPLISSDWTRPQTVGSVITYARRYALCALLQIATDDDDGQAAQQHAEARKPSAQPRTAKTQPVRPTEPYREWLEGFCAARNQAWKEKYPDSKGEFMPIFRMNRHLLGFLSVVASPKDEGQNLKAGELTWRDNSDIMADEALDHCRKEWIKRVSAEKAKATREPGSDDMPSPDEEAALDRLAAGKAVAG